MIGIQLFLFSGNTEQHFAWTIKPPITAAFLGAAYWSACYVEFLASRQRLWDRARTALPSVLIFTLLTLVVTLVHLDRFHFGAEHPLLAQAAAWVWIIVYIVVPTVMIGLLIHQLGRAGSDSPRLARLPMWLRLMLILLGAVLLIVGTIYLLAPAIANTWWFWQLTPLTGRALGAWWFGLGVTALHAVWEDDLYRVQVSLPVFAVFAILQFIVLARYPAEIQWGMPSLWIYVLVLIVMLVVGAYGGYLWKGNQKGAS